MLRFKDFYLIREGKFSKSSKVYHLLTLPMFTVYVLRDDLDKLSEYPQFENVIKNACAEARRILTKIGFPSMHANILLTDLSKEVNHLTGAAGEVAGYAVRKSKYMQVDINQILNQDFLTSIIIHEWAHLWMYNNSNGFKTAVKVYYNFLLNENRNKLSLPDVTLTQEDSDRVFKVMSKNWIPTINRLFSKTSKSETVLNDYILKYNTIGINNIEFVPHLTTIYCTSDKSFSDVSVGDTIYASKVSSGWILGSYNNSGKPNRIGREIVIPFDQLLTYVKEGPKEIEDKINERIDHFKTKSNRELIKLVMTYLRSIVESSVESSLIDLHIHDYRSYNYAEFVDSAVEILLPNFLDYLRNIVRVPDLGINAYSTFWVDPSHEAGVSFIKTVSGILRSSIRRKKSKEVGELTNLSGKANVQYRAQMKTLINWVDSYGLSDDHELWATGIEYFAKLPNNHRSAIFNLMNVRGSRSTVQPNRRMRKTIRSKSISNRAFLES